MLPILYHWPSSITDLQVWKRLFASSDIFLSLSVLFWLQKVGVHASADWDLASSWVPWPYLCTGVMQNDLKVTLKPQGRRDWKRHLFRDSHWFKQNGPRGQKTLQDSVWSPSCCFTAFILSFCSYKWDHNLYHTELLWKWINLCKMPGLCSIYGNVNNLDPVWDQ